MEVTKAYQKKVFLLAYSYLRNREDALDVVQETFLRLFQKAHMFQKGKNFQNWLLQIAKNICVDFHRKHGPQRRLRREVPIPETAASNLNSPSSGDPDGIQGLFSRCLDQLSEKQRLVFVMKHFNELSYEEIAQILKIALGTVKSLHFKAVRRLRTLMTPYIGRPG